MSYRLSKWEYDHGLGLGFRFPVSLPIYFTCETASFLRYAALRKHIESIPHDYFLRAGYLRNEAVSHVKCMGGARRGIETLTLTHDHIPIYPAYNSRFPCVHAKGCVHDFPLGRGWGRTGCGFRAPKTVVVVEARTSLLVCVTGVNWSKFATLCWVRCQRGWVR